MVSPDQNRNKRALVVGGGPAGLMAATVLAGAGAAVDLHDAMRFSGRKFVLAGRGGLNLTRVEPLGEFAEKYAEHAGFFLKALQRFSPDDLRGFFETFDVKTFVGSSGRVFPQEHSATEILARWHERLADYGVRFCHASRLDDIDSSGRFTFQEKEGTRVVRPDAAIIALGGASWPQTGSDGGWMEMFRRLAIGCKDLEPANCGVEICWSDYFREKYSGQPLKNLSITSPLGTGAVGDAVITGNGLEGGAIYPLIRDLREELKKQGVAVIRLDLKRDMPFAEVEKRLSLPRGRETRSDYLRKRLGLAGPFYSLLRECCPDDVFDDFRRLAKAIKELPITVNGLRPLAEAISSAGGVCFDEIDEQLMLKKLPGVFVAGEMIDWEAPTGGYLLQGAFSTGWLAGHGALAWLKAR